MILYRLLLSLIAPVAALMLLRRRMSGRLGPRGLAERLGRGPVDRPAPGGVTLWIHGASNGELTSARWLMQRLLARSPALHLVVTSDTETARNMVESWGEARISASLAPLDYRWALARFLNRVRPRALVILENELWPNRIVMAAARGVPVLMLGARISERSARPWARVPRLAARLMAGLSYLSAQDPGSEERFREMGLAPDRLGPRMNLKSQAEEGALPDLPEDLSRLFQRDRTLLAASTHPGEEALLLAAFARLRAEGLYDRLILAPRHPRRSAEVAAAIAAAGLAHTTRSAGEGPAEQAATAPVYLADTMGEMSLWYRLAGVTFLGGSLLPGPGGHNPYEPARFDTALVHGPHVANAAEAYGLLDQGAGSRSVEGAEALMATLAELADPAAQRALAGRATEVLSAEEAGQSAPLFAALAQALDLPALRG